MNVKEITEHKETTKIPNTPSFIDGIINIRGTVIPIINLIKRFDFESANIQSRRIIIVNINENQVGFLVDDASQVITLDENEIDDPPEIIVGIDRKFIVGIGKVKEKIIILLDLKAVLSEKEIEIIQVID